MSESPDFAFAKYHRRMSLRHEFRSVRVVDVGHDLLCLASRLGGEACVELVRQVPGSSIPVRLLDVIYRELAVIDVCGPFLTRVEDVPVLLVRCSCVDPVLGGPITPLFSRRARELWM